MKTFFISLILFLPSKLASILLKNIYNIIIINSKISPLNFFDIENVIIINSKVESFNYFNAKNIKIINSRIFKFNKIKYINKFYLKESLLGNGNIIVGLKQSNKVNINSNLFMNRKSELSGKHFLDVSDTIKIGKNVVVGGFGSVFWTHGFDENRKFKRGKIIIGDNVYFGSHCTITHDVNIRNNISIGTRSVITKSIKKSGFYYSELNKLKYYSK